jgi:hypothetical protein
MQTEQPEVQIRFLSGEDNEDLVRLAQRDTAALPPQPLLGGIVDGELVAAYSIPSRRAIADPFRPTAEIAELLSRWARRLR